MFDVATKHAPPPFGGWSATSQKLPTHVPDARVKGLTPARAFAVLATGMRQTRSSVIGSAGGVVVSAATGAALALALALGGAAVPVLDLTRSPPPRAHAATAVITTTAIARRTGTRIPPHR
jgi:hypothetical protein